MRQCHFTQQEEHHCRMTVSDTVTGMETHPQKLYAYVDESGQMRNPAFSS